jgi:hypothetical protein
MAHPELDRLMDHCLNVARKTLASGQFVPFAMAVRPGGAMVPVVLKVPEQVLSGAAIVEMLTSGLRTLARQQQAKALAVCYEGLLSFEAKPDSKQDAIVVGLEHVDGESVDVYLLYRKRKLFGYSFGELVALPRTRTFFEYDRSSGLKEQEP